VKESGGYFENLADERSAGAVFIDRKNLLDAEARGWQLCFQSYKQIGR
jgi:hypothetical protein